jgi:hypothetical protein
MTKSKALPQVSRAKAVNNISRSNASRRATLKQVNTLAWLLDNSIPIPLINYRIGLDAVVGLVPGLGDIAGLLVSSYIVTQAVRLGVPRATLMRMLVNITLEAAIGIIPILGDFFDATFKANARNVALLNEAVSDAEAGRTTRKVADTGFIAMLFGALLALLALVGGAGIALFSWLLSLFR